jgi:hypothetical protein
MTMTAIFLTGVTLFTALLAFIAIPGNHPR